MKLRTSSSNRTIFKKDITRFAPVWGGYTLMLLMGLLLAAEDRDYWTVGNMASSMEMMGLVACVYGLLTAQLLFGDLFNTRMCNALHAMPVRRESWFGVHVISGLLFHIVPAAVVALIAIPMANMSYVVDAWQVPLLWLAGCTLYYLFFFGLSVFCVMCTGNRFAMAVVYGMVNIGSLLVYFLTEAIYAPLLMGVQVMSDTFEDLSPVFNTSGGWAISVERIKDGVAINEFGVEEPVYHGEIKLNDEKWVYMAIIAVIGVVLLALALQMYRKRKLECAGDFSAHKVLDYVFQVLIALSSMAGMATMVNGFFGMDEAHIAYIMAAAGLIAGWFVGRMLMERTTRVFRLKNFLGMAAMLAAVALSIGLTVLDPLGIEDWVPKAEDLKSATLRLSYSTSVELTDKEDLEDIIAIHEKGLALRLDGEDLAVNTPPQIYDTKGAPVPIEETPAYYVTIIYEKNNGRHSQREYYIWLDDPVTELVREHCSTLDAVVGDYVADNEIITEAKLRSRVLAGGVRSINAGSVAVPEEFYTEEHLNALVDAIVADCQAGTLVQNAQLHKDAIFREEEREVKSFYLDFSPEDYDLGWGFSIYVYADSENLLKWVEDTGILPQVKARYFE